MAETPVNHHLGLVDQGRIIRKLVAAELAAGIAGLKLFMACVAIAAFMVIGVWVLGNGLSKALSDGGTTFLGGDIGVSVVNVPLADPVVDDLRSLGTVSAIAEMRSTARVGDDRAAVELKAVDDAYPLYGQVGLESGRTLAEALENRDGRPRVVAEQAFLGRVGGTVGDVARIGDAEFEIADVLVREPDRLSAGRFMVGPRVLMRLQDLEAAGLIRQGSLIDFRYRVRAHDDIEPADAAARARAMRPERGWELETPADAGDRVRRTVERTTTFLGMAGIVAFAIGLAGAWAAAKAWIGRRTRTIALYRLSGATPAIVGTLHAAIIGAASLCGLAAGLLAAVAGVVPVTRLVAGQLHLTLSTAALLDPLVDAAWILVLGVTGTSMLVLASLGSIRPGAAMRDGEVTLSTTGPGAALGGLVVLAALLGATLSLPIPLIAVASVIGLGAVVAVLAVIAGGLARAGTAIRARGFLSLVVQKGLGNGATVAARTIAIGIGIAGITAIVAAQNSLETALRSELPERVPDLVLLDVQPDQVEPIRARIDGDPGLGGLQADPFMRATITAVNGVPAEDALVRSDKDWVIEGDRSFSWAAEPTGAELLSGSWWSPDYEGPPVVSPEEDLQEAFGLKPGDTLTYSVLGRTFTSEVTNVRKEYHRTFRPEYLLVASPEPFRDAPHTWIMSLQGTATPANGPQPAVDTLTRDFARDYPNITSIDIRLLAAQLFQAIDGAISASLLVALVLVAAGALSIAAVTTAEVDARRREAIVFSLVGAARREVAAARLLEASAVGLIAAVVGGAAGLIGGYFAAVEALHVDWAPGTAALVVPVVLGVLATLPAGLVGGFGTLPRGRGQMARQLSG